MMQAPEELDLFFMQEALKEAKKAFKEGEVPVGAVVAVQNKIIARGHNQVELLKDATAHAEMLALTSAMASLADWRLQEAALYCTLEPCMMCAGAMYNSRLKRLVWGAEDIRLGAGGSLIDVFHLPNGQKHPFHQILITKNVLKEESSWLLKEFFQKQRQKKTAQADLN